jgi:5-methyltetrahydrofolate--homocysteine methyltransferase
VRVSATIIDNRGHNLTGQTIEAFFVSVKHARPFAGGVNYDRWAHHMNMFYKSLNDLNLGWCHVHTNAGLPNAMGG